MSDYLDINNEELLKDFFSEAEQQVEQLESNILVIENDPTNHEAIDEIFRAAHTLKGGSATVEMMELAEFTHTVEDLLDVIRSDAVSVTEDVVNVLLDAIDVIKAMLSSRADGNPYAEDVSDILGRLRSFIPQKAGAKEKKKPAAPAPKPAAVQQAAVPSVAASNVGLSEYELLELREALEGDERLWRAAVNFDESNPMNSVGGIQVFAALKDVGRVLKTVPDFDSLYEDNFFPTVEYYVASASDAETLKKAVSISDVTTGADVAVLADENASSQPVQAAASAETAAQKLSSEAPRAESASGTPKEEAASVPEAVKSAQPPAEKKADQQKKPQSSAHVGGSVLRVDSKRIDYLLNLVSETVITKAAFNQSAIQLGELQVQLQDNETRYKEKIKNLFDQLPLYLEDIRNGADITAIKKELSDENGELFTLFDGFDAAFKNAVGKFRSSAQNLGRIAGELQEGVMKIRMVPISQIFSRFPRVVRDLSRELNKKINLVIEGEDTELDKSVIEDLLDPIMHCVRNAVDHGVETPERRLEDGKPEEGRVLLKASNEGNMIVIEIADDGEGIDVEAVRNKAISRGLIHPTKSLTDVEAFQLIFEPGFSTSEKITNISGRGVGLDVVRTQIEKLNGSVTIESERGMGSKFIIKLPLTLAIIQGLLVRVGREIYSIPITSVIESHRVKADEISKIDNYEVFNVRNEVISLLRLNRLFGIKTRESGEYSFIVVVGTNDKKVGLMVDSLIGEEDVVIKPLRDQFTNSPGIAGASILGDGSVSLIIDVSQLLDLGLKQEMQARERRESSVW